MDESIGDVTNRLSGEGLQNEFLKRQARRFYRFNLLVPWTKTVQLAAFSTGKDLIRKNLELLNKGGLSKNKIQKLEGELFDLGIDITKGRNWLTKGGKTDDPYYRDIVKGAGRFTNSIILQTSREFGTVPTYMTNPKVDIFTQFLRYPTVFGNTVLKNFARDAITDPTVNAPKIAAFAVMATNIAKATNYWRTSPEERERIEEDGSDWRDTLKAFQRVGLLGPMEYGLRITEGMSYGQNPLVATAGVGGPVINDIIGLTLYNRGLLETAARKAPLVGTKNLFERAVGDLMEEYTGIRNPYTPLQKAGKEADKKVLSGFRSFANIVTGREGQNINNRLTTSNRLKKYHGGKVQVDPYTGQPYEVREQFVTGGLIEGEEEVPFTKEDPAERINKFTGEPYQEEMNRLGLSEGGSTTLPRGIRNNNPFNLAIGAVDKQKQKFIPYDNVARYNGVVGTDAVGTGIKQNEAYPIFETQDLGNRAGMHNLVKKYNNQTVDEMFAKYSATDRDTYANTIVSLTGLPRESKLNIKNNPELAAELARGIIILENGLTKEQAKLIPSKETLLKAHQDAQISKEDSKYSQGEWNTVKKNLQKTISKLFK
jgi:hypothetical protein